MCGTTWLIHTCDVSHSCMWQQYRREWREWLMYEWVMSRTWLCVRRNDLFITVTFLVHVTVTCLVHVCDNDFEGTEGNGSYMNGSCTYMIIYVTWLIRKCDMIHSCTWERLQREYGEWLIYEWVVYVYDHVCDVTHLYMWHDSFMHVRKGSKKIKGMAYIWMGHVTYMIMYVTWRIMSRIWSCMWRDSFINVKW